jgi:tetratricopeptide (TPR) repeat protein
MTTPSSVLRRQDCLRDATHELEPFLTAEEAAAVPDRTAALPVQYISVDGKTMAVEIQPESVGPDAPEIPGYEILRTLGQGGMGIVFLARQHAMDRLVAVKMILAGSFADTWHRERFRNEIRAAAQLRHPHIVQVHEVGERHGLPFCVMEYVDGRNLHQYMQSRPQPPQEAAAFLEKVARAIHAAHEKGIIHRDLKPANILLGGELSRRTAAEGSRPHPLTPTRYLLVPGLAELTPKIADFGLAKRLGQDSHQTPAGEVLGTPNYMAPEQASLTSQQIGPAADIHALGAILYEMLTGRPPYQGVTNLDTVLLVLHSQPVAPRQLQPAIPRDLETICLKCLAKEPQRRYATAVDLADDLRRFLNHEPIRARPIGWLGRGWRWCRRNPVVAGLLAALFLLLTAGTTVSTYFAIVAQQQAADALYQKDRADSAANQAALRAQEAEVNFQTARRAVDDFYRLAVENELFQDLRLNPARALLLEKVLRFYEQFRQQRQDDLDLLLQQADALVKIGRILAELNRPKEALQTLYQARELHETLATRLPGRWPQELERGRLYQRIGQLEFLLGQNQRACVSLAQAVALLTQLSEKQPGQAEVQAELVQAWTGYGQTLKDTNRFREAETAYRQARSYGEQLVTAAPGQPSHRDALARVWKSLGLLQQELGQYPESLAAFAMAEKLWSQLSREYPGGARYDLALADNGHGRAATQQGLGQFAAAEASYKDALERYRRLIQRYPEMARFKVHLATTWKLLGSLYREWQRPRSALTALAEAENLLRPLVKEQPAEPFLRASLAEVLHNIGLAHYLNNNQAAALEILTEAKQLREVLVRDHPQLLQYQASLAETWSSIAGVHSLRQQPDAARAAMERACTMQEQLYAAHPDMPDYAVALAGYCCNLAHYHRDFFTVADALPLYGKAISLLTTLRQKYPHFAMAQMFLRNSHWGRAMALEKLHEHNSALADWEQAVALECGLPFDCQMVRLGRAICLARLGQTQRAVQEVQQMHAQGKNLGASWHVEFARVYALAHSKAPANQTEEYATQAMARLRHAQGRGWFKQAQHFTEIETEADFASLRAVPAYQQWRQEVVGEKNTPK